MVKLWMKKISVILITFMTLGLYIPPTYLDVSAKDNESIPEKEDINEEGSGVPEMEIEGQENNDAPVYESDVLIGMLTEQAKQQAVSKLGPKIYNQVEAEFNSTILPGIEEVLETILMEAGEELPYYGITEQPSQGYGERIFNVYDYQNEQDVAKFHVRRDNRPGEGYWFNFHYHVSKDGFENHHLIGELYWDKNTPPKWMA